MEKKKEEKKEIDDLKKEINDLRSQLENSENQKIRSRRLINYFFNLTSKFILGRDLKKNTKLVISELYDKKIPSKENLSNFISALLSRITRIGALGVIITIIPTLILLTQSYLIKIQNDKVERQNQLFENQNTLLSTQNQQIKDEIMLIEASRRSSLVFLFSNVLDKIDEELSRFENKERMLSEQLIGRISALSKALKPYRYYEYDSLTLNYISPERGQLLTSLIESNINSKSLKEIFKSADFSYADLKNSFFENCTLENINLANSDLSNATIINSNFNNANLVYTNFNGSDIAGSSFENTKFSFASFSNTNLGKISFRNADLLGVEIISSYMTNVLFDNAKIAESNFQKIRMSGEMNSFLNSRIKASVIEIQLEYHISKIIDFSFSEILDTKLSVESSRNFNPVLLDFTQFNSSSYNEMKLPYFKNMDYEYFLDKDIVSPKQVMIPKKENLEKRSPEYIKNYLLFVNENIDEDQREKKFRILIDLNIHDTLKCHVWALVGDLLLNENKFKEAEFAFTKCIDLYDRNSMQSSYINTLDRSFIYHFRGFCRFVQRKHESAISDFEMFAKLNFVLEEPEMYYAIVVDQYEDSLTVKEFKEYYLRRKKTWPNKR